MVKLMQPTPPLPSGHPLLSFDYTDSDRWSADEMDAFHQGLTKYDKDFTSIAQEVIQFKCRNFFLVPQAPKFNKYVLLLFGYKKGSYN